MKVILSCKWSLIFYIQFSSVRFSHSVVSNSLQPHGLQHARPPCPSPTPGVYSDSCLSSRWCHPAISSSVVPFSFCPQPLPALRYFPMSQLFEWGGQSIGVSASASVLPMNTQDWSPLGWTGCISLQSKGLSRVFSNTTEYFTLLISNLLCLHIINGHIFDCICRLSFCHLTSLNDKTPKHVFMLDCVWLFVTSWTVAHQASLFMEFSRQEYWSGLPFPSPGDLLDPTIESMSLVSPALSRQILYQPHELGSPRTQNKFYTDEQDILFKTHNANLPTIVFYYKYSSKVKPKEKLNKEE